MSIAEIKRAPRNQAVLQLMEAVTNQIKESPDATEILIFVKIGEDYHRFSSGLEDMRAFVGMLELAKHDALIRMTP